MKNRHRIIKPTRNWEATSYFYTWDPDHMQWLPQDGDGTPLGLTLHPDAYFSEIWDAEGDYDKMHNCTHHSRQHELYSTSPTGVIQNEILYCASKSSLAKSYSIPTAYLYESTDTRILPSVDLRAVEAAFANRKLTTRWDLGRRYDPSKGFSIWMLLADIAQLPKLVLSFFRAARQLARYRTMTLREMADANLLVQFGLLPTIQDVRDFFRICQTWRQSYDTLIASQKSIHRGRFREEIDKSVFGEDGSFHCPVRGLGGAFLPSLVDVKTRAFHARALHHRVTCPELTGWLARVAQFIDAFGVLDPAAAWDRVPWSFVVDWFLPIGNWLQRHRPRVYPLDIAIHDFCESITVTQDWFFYANYLQGIPAGGPTAAALVRNFPYAAVRTKVYVRRRFIPPKNMLSPFTLSMPTVRWRRVSIVASLIAQRLPRG